MPATSAVFLMESIGTLFVAVIRMVVVMLVSLAGLMSYWGSSRLPFLTGCTPYTSSCRLRCTPYTCQKGTSGNGGEGGREGAAGGGSSPPCAVEQGPGDQRRRRPRRPGRDRVPKHAQPRSGAGRGADGPLQARGQQGGAPRWHGRRRLRRGRVPGRRRLEDGHA